MTVAGKTIVMSGGLVFEPQLHFDVFVDGRVAYSDSTAYQIKVASPEGEVIRILERPFDAEPVTDQIRSAVKAAQARKFKVGWRDKIWVQRRHSDVLWRPANFRETPDEYPSRPVDVLSAEGAYLGTSALKTRACPWRLVPAGW